MSGKHQRTWQQYHVGHLLITIQLDSAATGQKLERHQELAGVTCRLISLADSERLSVTWAVSDPAHSAATSLILQSPIEHEMAILGDATWVGATAGRTRFARELVRRLTQARAIGLEVNSFVPHVASIENQIDLVVKQHITAVAGFESPESGRRLLSPRALHYGVWELPISENLPLQTSHFFTGKRSLWKRVRRTISDAGTFHLIIDAPRVVEAGASTEKIIAWLVKRIALLRDRGMIHVETMRSMSARLSDVPAVRPQHSILRAAA
jgi:hypothetical protein